MVNTVHYIVEHFTSIIQAIIKLVKEMSVINNVFLFVEDITFVKGTAFTDFDPVTKIELLKF